MLSNDDVKEFARNAIIKKYNLTIAEYSKGWDIAPLTINSLSTYIIGGTNVPVAGVIPYTTINPNQLTIQFRLDCSSEERAKEIVEKVIDDTYEIKVASHYSDFREVATNLTLITGGQVKSVNSKTISDGGNRNAKYIHRSQGLAFVNKYVTNVKKMIYTDDSKLNLPSLTGDLEDRYAALLQQAMTSANETKLDIKFYDEVWSATNFNPDRITNEMKKWFTYNEAETKKQNSIDKYFTFNRASINLSSSSGIANTCYPPFCTGIQTGLSDSLSEYLSKTTQSIFSLTEIQNLFKKISIDIAWTNDKFNLKSFSVYRINDITDMLQVDIFNKQLIVEEKSGATIRRVNSRTRSLMISDRYSCPLVGEMKLYLGKSSCLPCTWMYCHGQTLSRVTYHLLFSVIGESFGAGDGKTTFNLPDFRRGFPGIFTDYTRI
ncbi:unnamed protein product [Rotaria sp. Silwood1]|nr:unnamed protein product [Rotaria sp. Silwood1]CAF4934015.1 unnamed protein product [Rotaria sp. Silwood1]